MPWSREDLTRLVELEAHQQGVDPRLAVALAEQESKFDPLARSPKGAYGIMQLMPGTAKQLGVNAQDPADNIRGGVTYLKQQLDAFGGDPAKAVAAYNAGPGVVKAYKGVPPYKETRGLVSRVLGKLGPSSAEAATPQAQPQSLGLAQTQASGMSRLQELEAHLARLEGQAAPQPPQAPAPTAQPAPPTATSTPEQDAAYRASRGTQATPPASQAAPTAQTPPDASQAAQTPDTSWTPGMRFQALPSITQLEPADRMQKTKLFESLDPQSQEEFLRSEEPASDITVDIEKPSTPQATSRAPADLDEALTRELAPAQKGMPLLLGGAGAGALGRSAGAWAAGKLGRLGTALPIVGEGLANLGFRKGAVAAGMEEQGTAGDVAAVAAPAVLGLAAPVVAKVGNALKGVVKSASQPIVDLAERYGVRLSYGDVTKGAAIPKVEAALEAIPSGAGRMRVGQQADVTKAAETVRTGLQAEMQAIPWRNLPALQRAAGQGNQQAQALLNEISAAGDDWGRVIQASGKLNLWQDRQRANQLYGRVERLAQPLGNMPVTKTVQAMDDAVDDVTRAVLPSPELQREVETLMTRAKTELTPTAAGAVPDTTYSRMKRLREDLGDMQRTATDPRTARYLGQVKTALQDDMRDFAITSKVPALVKAHKQADDFYRTRVVPYREGQLAKAIEKDLPDEIYGKFVRQGADRAQFFYKGLDQRGQAAVRYGMVDEAVKDAASIQHPDVFSPARFVASMRRIQDASGVFFKGAPQWEINGVTKLMQHAQRAGQYAENPPTGLRAGIGGLAIGAGVASWPTVLGTMLSAQGLRMMLMTKTGRNFLLAASDMQPGSSAFQKHLDAFLQRLPAGAAGVGAVERAREETTAP